MVDLRLLNPFIGTVSLVKYENPGSLGVNADLWIPVNELPTSLFASERYHAHLDSLWNSDFKDKFLNRDCEHKEYHVLALDPGSISWDGELAGFHDPLSWCRWMSSIPVIPDGNKYDFIYSPSGLGALLPGPMTETQVTDKRAQWVVAPNRTVILGHMPEKKAYASNFIGVRSVSRAGRLFICMFSGQWNWSLYDPTKPQNQPVKGLAMSLRTYGAKTATGGRATLFWSPTSKRWTTSSTAKWNQSQVLADWPMLGWCLSMQETYSQLVLMTSTHLDNIIWEASKALDDYPFAWDPASKKNTHNLRVTSSDDSGRELLVPVLNHLDWLYQTEKPRLLVTNSEWGELGNECVDNCASFSSNLIAYASDIPKVGDSVRALLALVADPTDPKKWASAWLSSRFGDRLQAKDSIELIGSIRSELKRLAVADNYYREQISVSRRKVARVVSGALFSNCVVEAWSRLYWRPNVSDTLSRTVKKLLDWDAWPTLENTWDMIPLSFVVDWFLNVSEVLQGIDRENYMLYLKVVSTLRTQKVTLSFSPSAYEIFSKGVSILEASVSYYSRRQSPKLVWRPISWKPGLPSSINVVDGASLLYQFLG